jgi:hypothetical protein
MEYTQFNPADSYEYDNFISENDKKRSNIILWTIIGLIVFGTFGYVIYKLIQKPKETKEKEGFINLIHS